MAKHVALDCHQSSVYAVAATPAGEILWRRRFPASAAGEEELRQALEPEDIVVLEATRGAHHLANRLDSSGATVRIIDPHQASLVGFRGKKTDYRDCLALLQHLRSDTLVDVWRPDATTRVFRQLTRERFAYNQGVVQLKNRIRAFLREEGLTCPGDLLWQEEGAEWIAEQALPEAARRILQREWTALQTWTTVKEGQEAEIAALALKHPEALRLMQIMGFGPTAILVFFAEVGSLDRFPDAKHLVSYAGLDPRVHQSGERSRGGGISKAGRSQLRWILVEVAWSHVLANGPEAGHYHQLVARGKPKRVAIVALARRLLALAYLLLKRQENHRELNQPKYEAKLVRIARRRAPEEIAQARHVDWAAAQFEKTVGTPAPSRQQRSAAESNPNEATDPQQPSSGSFLSSAPGKTSERSPESRTGRRKHRAENQRSKIALHGEQGSAAALPPGEPVRLVPIENTA